jgi:hypothetical protein
MTVKKSQSKLDFWRPLWEFESGYVFSPGFTSTEGLRTIWDYVIFTINGVDVPTPGIADVRFMRSKNKDHKKPVGEDATTTTTSGIKAATIVIELEIWMPFHLEWIETYMPILFPKPGKSSGQFTFKVKHPLFGPKQGNIKAVSITDWEGPMKHSVPGAKIFRIHCVEYLPTTTKKAGGTVPPPSLAAETSQAAIGLQSLPGDALAKKTGT